MTTVDQAGLATESAELAAVEITDNEASVESIECSYFTVYDVPN